MNCTGWPRLQSEVGCCGQRVIASRSLRSSIWACGMSILNGVMLICSAPRGAGEPSTGRLRRPCAALADRARQQSATVWMPRLPLGSPAVFPLPRQHRPTLAEAAIGRPRGEDAVDPEIAEIVAHGAPGGDDLLFLVIGQCHRPDLPLRALAVFVAIVDIQHPLVANRF